MRGWAQPADSLHFHKIAEWMVRQRCAGKPVATQPFRGQVEEKIYSTVTLRSVYSRRNTAELWDWHSLYKSLVNVKKAGL